MPFLRNKFILITGAPGVGKSTLINALSDKYTKVKEPAREIIYEQRHIGGQGIWQYNREFFLDLILSRSIHNYNYFDPNTITLFDRGIPDVIAYASHGNIDLKRFKNASSEYRYNNKVFILEPWREIYKQDDERSMEFEDVEKFHNQIFDAYSDYNLIIVPKDSIDKRVNFIERYLEENK